MAQSAECSAQAWVRRGDFLRIQERLKLEGQIIHALCTQDAKALRGNRERGYDSGFGITRYANRLQLLRQVGC